MTETPRHHTFRPGAVELTVAGAFNIIQPLAMAIGELWSQNVTNFKEFFASGLQNNSKHDPNISLKSSLKEFVKHRSICSGLLHWICDKFAVSKNLNLKMGSLPWLFKKTFKRTRWWFGFPYLSFGFLRSPFRFRRQATLRIFRCEKRNSRGSICVTAWGSEIRGGQGGEKVETKSKQKQQKSTEIILKI